jgi:type I restriction enzyme S subunit
MRDGWRLVQLGEVATLDVEKVRVVPGTTYQIAGVLNAGQGMLRRDPIDGSDTNYPALHRLRAGQRSCGS